jgi:dihydrofolate synthase / folylpolyglutamate synthase
VDALAYLLSLEQLGIKFGLDNIRAICEALGHPERAWPSAVVAGTNGKGSVSAMLEAGLRAAGFRTGLYTSPHLVRLEERFAIDGTPVSTADMAAAAATVRDAVARLRSTGRLATEPTFFEVTTALGFELFRRARATFVVLEVGLGGRFDATTAATPVAAAITTIDFDHERFLGYTIAAIAAEKAGVVKPGIPVVVGETKPEAVAAIERACAEQHAPVIPAGAGVRSDVVATEDGAAVVRLSTPVRDYGTLRLSLRGGHQVRNAVVAVRLLEELDRLGFRIPPAAVAAAVTSTRWPGRLDLVSDAAGRTVLCDAAHNPAGARALAEYLRQVYPAGLPLVFGIMKDKDVGGTLGPLLRSATHLVATEAHTDRAMAAGRLAAEARRAGWHGPLDVEPEPSEALARAWNHARTICAAGSIFLVGEVLARLRSNT